jgi:apolipoprotein N-acyltransferase
MYKAPLMQPAAPMPIAEFPKRASANSPWKASGALHLAWIWLVVGAVLLMVSDGRNTIAIAAWLSPVCLIRFLRLQPVMRGIGLVYLLKIFTFAFANRGMIPIPGALYYLFLAVSALTGVLPYLIDRLLASRLSTPFRAFVFPAALVSVQFAVEQGAHGSWGSPAYTQAHNLPLLQSLSVAGLWGITFLIGWFAAVANVLLERLPPSKSAIRAATLFGLAYAVVISFGAGRLTFFPPQSAAVRVASLSPLKTGPAMDDKLLCSVIDGKASSAQNDQFDALNAANQDSLFSRSKREAEAGAKIIVWSEEAASVSKENEAGLISRAQQLASSAHVYLGLGLAVWSRGQQRPLENEIVLLRPGGTIAFRYLKTRPTPGPEMAMSVHSDGRLPLLTTPFGTLSAAICYDMDFPALMAQAGKGDVDLLVSPASDWAAIDPRHTEMAQFRAIEQGFNLVRQANLGRSAAFDFQGRTLASMDEYSSSDLALVAEVPTRGVKTIYSRCADWLAWLSVLIILWLAVAAFRDRNKNAKFDQV